MDLSRFDAAPLIAFTAPKEINYGTETDGRISARCGAYRADQWAYTQAGGLSSGCRHADADQMDRQGTLTASPPGPQNIRGTKSAHCGNKVVDLWQKQYMWAKQ
jgi:hypothetical protein